jgi:hypothetical protein
MIEPHLQLPDPQRRVLQLLQGARQRPHQLHLRLRINPSNSISHLVKESQNR